MTEEKNIKNLRDAAEHLAELFNDNPEKITYWWLEPNPFFGHITQARMYLLKRDRFFKIMTNLINGNIA